MSFFDKIRKKKHLTDAPVEIMPNLSQGQAKHAADVNGSSTAGTGTKSVDSKPQTDAALSTNNTGDTSVSPTSLFSDADDEALEDSLAYKSLMEHRKKRRRKRIIKISVLAVIIAVILIFTVVKRLLSPSVGAQTSTTITAIAEKKDFLDEVNASGNAKPISSVVVNPEISGSIASINVKEGDSVSKGDLLFTVKNDELDKSINKAARAVESAKRSVNIAQQALDAAYADTGLIDEAGNILEAPADPTQAEFELASAKDALAEAQDAYNQAVAEADKRNVIAPITGSIVDLNISVGSSVGSFATAASDAAATNSIQIADLTQMRVTIQVNELDISRLSVGQSATVSFAALPHINCAATVESIATVSGANSPADSFTDTGAVTYAVDLIIAAPDPRIKPGMTASVSIKIQEIPDSLCIPQSCITTDENGKSTVELIVEKDKDGQIKKTRTTEIEVAAQNGADAVVKSGLNEGDELIMIADEGLDMSEDAMQGA